MNIQKISELKEVWSPEYLIQDTLWKIKAATYGSVAYPSLGIFLYCEAKNKPVGWTHAAMATFKLLSFDANKFPIQHHLYPYVFKSNGQGYGNSSIIKWKDLFAAENSYVKNDAINLKITIEAADSDAEIKSHMQCEDVLQSCCVTKKRLTISNVNNLLALRSPEFQMQRFCWELSVLKCSDYLDIRLLPQEDANCNVTMKVKLFPCDGKGNMVEQVQERQFKAKEEMKTANFIKWAELIKPANGYVRAQDNSIVIEVEMHNPIHDLERNNNPSTPERKRKRLECAICLESPQDKQPCVTPCGHLFCRQCITTAIQGKKVCPTCQKEVTANSLLNIYL